MLKIRDKQLHRIVFQNESALINDVMNHLEEYCPQLFAAYPLPYLRWAVKDSIEIASRFKIDDVHTVRTFVRLRWDIAPGYFKHPRLAAVLEQTERPASERFDELATEEYAAAWEEATELDDPHEWRARFWRDGYPGESSTES